MKMRKKCNKYLKKSILLVRKIQQQRKKVKSQLFRIINITTLRKIMSIMFIKLLLTS
jgi:hypothetical protein